MKFQLNNWAPFLVKRKFHLSSVCTNKTNPLIDSIIRVDHAGELGADRIYAGQMAVLGNTKIGAVIQHMWDQEKVHRETFEKLIIKYRVRPTALTPVWNTVGFLLGAGTALLGEKAAMACTVAVESVIVDHYNDQLRMLMAEPEKNKELMETIQKFRDDEQDHHDSGIDHGAENAPFYWALSEVIKFGCKQAIAISKGLSHNPNRFNFFISRNYGTVTNIQHKLKWDLYSAVCLERKPLVMKPLNDLERKVLTTLLDIESEKSCKSDHEIKGEADAKRAEQFRLQKKFKDVDLDAALQQTAHEFEEISNKEFDAFEMASLVTEADKKNDVKSLNRKLSSHLLLLINHQIGNENRWILPHGIRKESETMRETAERVLSENFGDSLKVLFLGNAPCGFYKYKYPKKANMDADGAKIFFFKALYIGGNIDEKKNSQVNYRWASRPEFKTLVNNKKYLKKVSLFLIDDEDETETRCNQ